jgi:hypothetical protein
MDCRLILEKSWGFSTKFLGFIEIMNFWNYFLKEILIDSVYHGPAMDGRPELAGAWPLAVLSATGVGSQSQP